MDEVEKRGAGLKSIHVQKAGEGDDNGGDDGDTYEKSRQLVVGGKMLLLWIDRLEGIYNVPSEDEEVVVEKKEKHGGAIEDDSGSSEVKMRNGPETRPESDLH